MWHRRLARALIYPTLLLAVAPGCQALYSYRPVAVLARDAETKKPIPDADIRLSYPLTPPARGPWESFETTGTDGVAHLRAASFAGAAILVQGTANGYLAEEKDLSATVVAALEPAHLFEEVERRPISFVLELYAKPHPTVELVLPTGYRGLVKAVVQVQDDTPLPPGQRCFSYLVPPSGVVQVTGPFLLRRIFPPDFLARYADGTALSCDPKGLELGCRWLKREGDTQYFVVGTVYEFDAYRRDLAKEEAGGGRFPGGGKGEGRSRHKRGRGQPPADSGPSE